MPLDVASVAASSVPSNMDMLNLLGGQLTNVQNQKANLGMYKLQYEDAIKFWNMNNAYNTPANQMQRFKDAGLSPYLAYGQGSAGNSSGAPNVPDLSPANFREPKFEGNQSLLANQLASADLRIKAAQANNLETQTEVIRQDATLRRLQGERADYDLSFEKRLTDTSADARREQLRKLKIDNDVTLNRDAREATMNASSVTEAAERVLSMRAQRGMIPYQKDEISQRIKQMQLDGTLKQLDIDLRKAGIQPGDPMWARVVGRYLSDTMETGTSKIGNVWKWLTGQDK